MKKLCFTLILVFLSILLFTSVGFAGEKKNQKNSPSELWGKDREALCHITGSYDFGAGEVPIGHVIKVPESAYLSRIKHGDTGNWDVYTLPDGKEVCYEPVEVCHITDYYDFGEGYVQIGQVTRIPATYYQIHTGHGDPETYKVVTLPDDESEVCLALGAEETQFSKGIALFGHNVDSGVHFTRRLTREGKILGELTRYAYSKDYQSMTSFFIEGKQYLMAISDHDDDGHRWFIQQILPSGDFGPITDHGNFRLYYKTLISLQKADGEVFIFAQADGNDNRAMVMQINSGGKLGDQTWHDYWIRYYDTATALPLNYGRPIFFIHNSNDDHPWHIACLRSDGTVYIRDTGDWDYGYQVATSYRRNGPYLLAHRHRYDWSEARDYGPRMIRSITDDSHMGGLTTAGEWQNFYKTLTLYGYPSDGLYYVIGHNTDKRWFTERVNVEGHIYGDPADHGNWDDYYEHLFPIDYDADTYAKVDNWMEHLNDVIGDRKLREIALPGSHDAGMNKDDTHGCSAGGHDCNTVTQIGDIGYQLAHGARYFDIRPMIDTDESGSNDWTTGHGAKVLGGLTAGCRGESKLSITNSLNDFFEDPSHSKELVILKVSHCTTPPGIGFAECTDTQIDTMASNLAGHLDEHLVKGDDCNITDMTLNQILEKGNIILVVEGARNREKGIFRWGYGSGFDYYNYDEYSNTDDFDTMVHGGDNNSGKPDDGQKKKLLTASHHKYTEYTGGFLLSWTLTLSEDDAIFCRTSILDYAAQAQPRIFEYIYDWAEKGLITKSLFPNILYVDTFWRTQTNAAIYLNKIYDSLPD